VQQERQLLEILVIVGALGVLWIAGRIISRWLDKHEL
jgi:hypothetical protein